MGSVSKRCALSCDVGRQLPTTYALSSPLGLSFLDKDVILLPLLQGNHFSSTPQPTSSLLPCLKPLGRPIILVGRIADGMPRVLEHGILMTLIILFSAPRLSPSEPVERKMPAMRSPPAAVGGNPRSGRPYLKAQRRKKLGSQILP